MIILVVLCVSVALMLAVELEESYYYSYGLWGEGSSQLGFQKCNWEWDREVLQRVKGKERCEMHGGSGT